jgi:iron complex transport system substrate-binding protein
MADFSLVFKKKITASAPIQLLLGALLVFFSGCHQAAGPATTPSCERLVSFSPSITEMVYALHLDKNLVGVTRFCKYPPQAQQKTSVGGYLDPNLEAVIRLQPTLVLLRNEQSDLKGKLANFQRPTLSVEHRTVPGILKSFQQIGKVCNRQAEATQLVSTLEAEIAQVQSKTRHVTTHPRVLVVVDRDTRYDTIHQVYAAAHDNFYDWILANAGGKNAYPGKDSGFSAISSEGILRMNPDVIIEILPSLANSTLSKETILKPWLSLSHVSAVKNRRIYLFTQDYIAIPGPRFVKILERFAEALHPELDWGQHG